MGGNESLEEKGFFFKPSHFAVLLHIVPTHSLRATHWDLLLEHPHPGSDSLLSFELLVPPEKWSNPTAATRLPDHRPRYLTYEGPISNDRGHVKRILQGSFDWVKATECSLIVRLKWEKLEEHTEDVEGWSTRSFSGMLELHRNQNLPEFAIGSWQLTLSEHAGSNDPNARGS